MSTYTVNTLSDAVTPVAGQLTLRQAVADANAHPGPDTIAFFQAVFTPGSLKTIDLSNGPIAFTDTTGATTVNGPGLAVLSVSGNNTSRVFQISGGVTVAISGLTVTDGHVATFAEVVATGGGVLNAGSLTLTDATVTGNTVVDGYDTLYSGNGGSVEGGGIYSTGSLSLVSSVVSGNAAHAGNSQYPGGGNSSGGGIYSSGPLMIVGSNISGNTVTGGYEQGANYVAGGNAAGGGIYSSGTLSISSTIVETNTVSGGELRGNAIAYGGSAFGGGIVVKGSSQVVDSNFRNNQAKGGYAANGGGIGGPAMGGAIYSSNSLSITSSSFTGNQAVGGDGPGQDNGPGANGYGGAIASEGSLTVSGSDLASNIAEGGSQSYDPQSDMFAAGYGGGIYSAGSLILVTSTLSGNTAEGGPGALYAEVGGYGVGGGLFTGGTSTINSSSLFGNTAEGGIGGYGFYKPGGNGGPGEGGGVFNNSILTITNSTITSNISEGGAGSAESFNEANGGNGGNGSGSAIYTAATFTLDDSTVTGDTTSGGAGGLVMGNQYVDGTPGHGLAAITIASGSAVFNNSIIAGNLTGSLSDDDISGNAGSTSGNNLIGTGGGLTDVNGNIIGVINPDLMPLGNYGGPTETMLPQAGSPVIDAGSNSLIPAGVTTDQRGYSRIVGSSVDIGAVEYTASVFGTVFDDYYGDGTRGPYSSGIAGVTVYADISNTGLYQAGDPSTVTDSSGNYVLNGLPAGANIIRELLPSGERQSLPAGGNGQHITVGATAVTGVNFAESTNLFISGSVTLNGVGQGGVLVYTDSDEESTFTASDGTFSFVNLSPIPGNHTIQIVPPPGDVQLSPASGAGITVTLGSGGVDQGLNFTVGKQLPAAPLTGTVIGTAGSYRNHGTVAPDAFDGNLNTYFDAPTASGSYAGLDLGKPQVIGQISYAPRSGLASRMVGGVFQASNNINFSSGVVTLYTVTSLPATGVYTTVTISNQSAFEFVRYLGPANSYCDVAEIEFFAPSPAGSVVLQPNGTLLITGTNGPDNISVDIESDDTLADAPVTVEVNGVSQSFIEAGITSIMVNSMDGNDQLSFTTGSEGVPPPAINVVEGNGNDSLTTYLVMDYAENDEGNNISIMAGSGNDSFDLEGSEFATTVTAGNGNDSFLTSLQGDVGFSAVITAGNGNDTLMTGSSGGAGNQEVSFSAGTGQDDVTNTDEDDYDYGTIGGVVYTLSFESEYLLGNVYADSNRDAKYEQGEPTVANAPVSFSNSYAGTFGTMTDAAGDYLLAVPSSQDYSPPTLGGNFPITLYQGELISGVDLPLDQPLSGTVIGTTGSYQNDGNTIAKAFDGNLNTFFDAPIASGSYAGLYLGSAKVIKSIVYAPRTGWASRMVGGVFQGSDSATFASGVVTLYAITATPATGVLTTAAISNTSAFEYVRYLGPANSYCDIAEAEFFDTVSVAPEPLTGIAIGTAGSYRNHGTTIANVFDGNLSTYFDGPDATGDWVGLDLGSAKVVTQFEYAPRTGWESRMDGGEIQASNSANFSSGVVTLYTIGSTPTAGVLTTQSLNNSTAYRYYRYLGPANGYCDIAELVFEG